MGKLEQRKLKEINFINLFGLFDKIKNKIHFFLRFYKL